MLGFHSQSVKKPNDVRLWNIPATLSVIKGEEWFGTNADSTLRA